MCSPEDFKVKRIAFEYNIFNVFNLFKKKTNLFYEKVTH